MNNVFISYRRTDSPDVTGRIYDHLVNKYKRKRVFKDVDSIEPGMPFAQYIQGVIRQSAVALVIIGPEWLIARSDTGSRRLDDPRDFVRLEIESALREGVAIIPVLVRGAAIPPANQLPPTLQPVLTASAVHVRPDPDFHRDMDRLFAAIDQWMNRPRPRTQPIAPLLSPAGGGAPGGSAPAVAGQQPGDTTLAGWVYLIGLVPGIGWILQLSLSLTTTNRLMKAHAIQATMLSLVNLPISISLAYISPADPKQGFFMVALLALFCLWLVCLSMGFGHRPTLAQLISGLWRRRRAAPPTTV